MWMPVPGDIPGRRAPRDRRVLATLEVYPGYGDRTVKIAGNAGSSTPIVFGGIIYVPNSTQVTLATGTGVTQTDPAPAQYPGYSSLLFNVNLWWNVGPGSFGPLANGYASFTVGGTLGSGAEVLINLLVWTDQSRVTINKLSMPGTSVVSDRTATFMLGGDICTRHCGFCAVGKGEPGSLDPDEPRHVAEAVRQLNLAHTVITSVNRDDLPDGGAAHWAETVRQVRALNPECKVEVLIPDFNGDEDALNTVLDAQPDVLNHNTETIARLYRRVRPDANYQQTLTLLQRAADRRDREGRGPREERFASRL